MAEKEPIEFPPIRTEVELPRSLREALTAFAEEPTETEWGGGIDFEIIRGKPRVERVLAYLGAPGAIPREVWEKYGSDVEVSFHTHPKQPFALPSRADINTFLNSPRQVSIIACPLEILVMTKTEKAKPTPYQEIEKALSSDVYRSPAKMKERLEELGIKAEWHPVAEKIRLDLAIIRKIPTREFNYEKYLIYCPSPIPFILYVLEVNMVPLHLRLIIRDIYYEAIELYKSIYEYYEDRIKKVKAGRIIPSTPEERRLVASKINK